jgi:two-component system chemotaxis response regulator CheB
VTFASAAVSYGRRTVGVVLTGANADGSAGLSSIAAHGGMALIQSPATAERPMMPDAAVRAVPGARVMDLSAIATFIATLPAGTPERGESWTPRS